MQTQNSKGSSNPLNGPRRYSLLGIAVAAALALPHTTLAQENDSPEQQLLLEEVIVTAQRREQTLQEVPMAISAFTSDQLRDLQADNLGSIQGAVPNLNLVQGRGSSSSVNVFIRGVGQPDALQTFDPAVGIYLDDVYISRIQGALFKLYDIERIEVLRGPQGTLYGKNTPGGAIRLITRTPGDEFEAAASLIVGDYDRVEGAAYLSGPVSENLSLGLSVLHNQRDGFVTDPITGLKYNDEYTSVARFKGAWDASENVQVLFSADYTKEDVALTLGNAEAPLTSIDLGTGQAVVRYVPPPGPWGFNSSTSLSGDGQQVESWGTNLTVAWDIKDDLLFKSITAYRELETNSFIDIDATTLELGDVFVGLDQDQFSQEFQLLGNTDTVSWVAGVYYLDEHVPSNQAAFADDFLLFNGIPISFERTIMDDLRTKSWAVFGQVDWQFAENWNLGVGIRYTDEKKDYFRTTSTFSDILGSADPAYEFSDSDSWSDWTPSFTLDYTVNDNVNLYARVANGFKSGGFNGRANNPADTSSFDPETVWTAEVGAKTIMADGRFQANYAIFTSTYDDFQARVSETNGIDFSFPVLNAAELDLSGAEIDMAWLVTDALQLNTQIGYLDAKYGAGGFTGADGVADEPAFSPEWTVRVAGIYTIDLSSGAAVRLGADYNYRDSMWLSVDNVEPLLADDFYVLNGFVSWASIDEVWTVTAGIKNATDELYKVEGQEFRAVGNIQTAYYGDPRTWTLRLDYRY